MPKYKEKNVLITGGTKGLGLELARRFAREGANCYLGYRSDVASAKSAEAEIRQLGVNAFAIAADLAENDGMEALFTEVQRTTSVLDFYIHNAAATAFKPLLEIKAHHVQKTMNLTVTGLILGAQLFSKMCPAEGGAIVAISGMDTLVVVPRHGLLGAAKAGIEQVVRYLGHELSSNKIRVNAVNPGFLETESTKLYLGNAFAAVSAGHAAATPAKRPATLAEVAHVVEFLCQPETTWIVGQTIVVDGGFNQALTLVPTVTKNKN